MAYSCVRVQFEIGHEASIRNKRTPEGFTHDWEVFVRGVDNAEIHHFIDKVVFLLHDTFPKPKRVVKEPPYCVKESGYAGFNLPIDIYFKGKGEDIRKLRFYYDLTLQSAGPRISNFVREKADFSNPSEELRRKLLKGGGIGIGNDGANSSCDKGTSNNNLSVEEKKSSPLTSKPKISTGGDIIKKHKVKDTAKQDDLKNNSSFAALFGPPIKTSKHSPTNSKPTQPKVSQTEKSAHEKQAKEVTKLPKHSPHKEKDREGKDSVKKEKDLDRSSSKEKDRIKEKESHREKEKLKEKQLKKSSSPIPPIKTPKDEPPPKKATPDESKEKPNTKSDIAKVEKKHKEKKSKDGSKEKKDKHFKEHHEKKDQEKEKIHEKIEKKIELAKEVKIEVAPKIKPSVNKEDKKSKTVEKEKDRSSDIDKQRHKHKKKDKHKDEDKERQRKKEEKATGEIVRIKPISPNISPGPAQPPPPQQQPESNIQKQAIRPLHRLLEELHTNSRTEKDSDSDLSMSNDDDIKCKSQPPPQQSQPPPPPEPSPPVTKQPKLQLDDRTSKELKDERSRKREKKTKEEEKESRKRKRKMKEKEQPEEKMFKIDPKEDSSRSDRSSPVAKSDSSSPSPDTLFTDDYVTQLKDLQHKIMTLQDNADLQRVVQVISETGQFEITPRTFDFDLCALDRNTVKRLQDMFVGAS